jgi:hypothetical protein
MRRAGCSKYPASASSLPKPLLVSTFLAEGIMWEVVIMNKRRIEVVTKLAICCALIGCFTEQAQGQFSPIGRWGHGSCGAVALDDGFAYFGDGATLKKVNTIDPSYPIVAEVLTESYIRDIIVDDNIIYIADDRGGLKLLYKGSLETANSIRFPSPVIELDIVSDTLLIVLTHDATLYTVLINEHGSAWSKRYKKLPASNAYGLEVGINNGKAYAYVGCGPEAMYIVDVLSRAISGPFSYDAYGLVKKENYLYIAQMGHGFSIVDVRDPSTGVPLVFHHDSTRTPRNMTIVDEALYIASLDFGAQIFDITNPTSPQHIGYCASFGYSQRVAVNNDILYLAATWGGFVVFDISNPSVGVETRRHWTPHIATTLDLQGSRAYVANGFGGLRILDVSDATKPTELGSINWPTPVYDVAVDDTLAFLAVGNDGIRVISVSDPAAPYQVNVNDTLSPVMRIVTDGAYIYAALEDKGFAIYEIMGTNLFLRGHLNGIGKISNLAVQGEYAYLIEDNEAIRIVNVSSKDSPFFVTTETVPNLNGAIAIKDSLLVVANSNSLFTYSISNPAKPTRLGSNPYVEGVHDIFIYGGLAVVADFERGCLVFDIRDTHNPKLIANYETWYHPRGVVVRDDTVYVSDGDNGVHILWLDPLISVEDIAVTASIIDLQLYPNPAPRGSTILYTLDKSVHVNINVYDVLGKEIAVLERSRREAGTHTVEWNPDISAIPEGIYFIRLSAGGSSVARQIILTR